MPINWKKSKSLPSSFNNVRKTPNQFYSLLNSHFFLNQFTIHLPHVLNLFLLIGWLCHKLIMPREQSNVAKRLQAHLTPSRMSPASRMRISLPPLRRRRRLPSSVPASTDSHCALAWSSSSRPWSLPSIAAWCGSSLLVTHLPLDAELGPCYSGGSLATKPALGLDGRKGGHM